VDLPIFEFLVLMEGDLIKITYEFDDVYKNTYVKFSGIDDIYYRTTKHLNIPKDYLSVKLVKLVTKDKYEQLLVYCQ
ncbi:22931_t:CDS:1, partial [Racocetra persica]